MQKLTDQLKAENPGIVIYGIGDAAHKRSPSGHNEDDTPGSKPEQEDPDSKPEHRAIDVMIGKAFTVAEAWDLVSALVTVPANRARLLYVIFMRKIWRAKNGWREENYTGSDPHTNHPHVSGTWQDDENTAPWVLHPSGSGGATPPPATAPTGAIHDMYMIQRVGNDSVYVSNSQSWRGIDWPTFLFYRDVLKLAFTMVPDDAALSARGGVPLSALVEQPATFSEAQMARVQTWITEAVGKAGVAEGSISADTLRKLMDEEALSAAEFANALATARDEDAA